MIPVFEPVISEDEIEAVVDALRKGEVSGSFGNYLKDFEAEFATAARRSKKEDHGTCKNRFHSPQAT